MHDGYPFPLADSVAEEHDFEVTTPPRCVDGLDPPGRGGKPL